MIANEQIILFAAKARENLHFTQNLEIAIKLAENYDSNSPLGTDFAVAFEKLLTGNKWSRQLAYGFITIVWKEYERLGLLSDVLNDELDGLHTGIVGDCSPECILVFYGDPIDQSELTKYVRSEFWVNEDYYSGIRE